MRKCGKVLGHLVSVDAFGEAYIIPLDDTLQDIKKQLQADEVRLADPNDGPIITEPAVRSLLEEEPDWAVDEPHPSSGTLFLPSNTVDAKPSSREFSPHQTTKTIKGPAKRRARVVQKARPHQIRRSLRLAQQRRLANSKGEGQQPAKANFEQPQGIWGNTPVGGRGAMTGGNDMGGYPQIHIPASVAANIVVESYDQQQRSVSSILPSQPHLSTSVLETLNQHPPSLGRQRNNTQDQDPFDSSGLLPFLLTEWNAPIIVRTNRDLRDSCIYSDILKEVPDRKILVHPRRPPGHYTLTQQGYAPKGGHCIQVTLKNRRGQAVQLPLAILDRGQQDEKDVDVVLGQDYLRRYAALHNTPMRVEQLMVDMGLPNESHQGWQTPSQSQDAPTSLLDPNLSNDAPNYISPMWPSGNNQTQGVHMHPQYLAPPSFTNIVPSSQGSSGLVHSSATSPDGLSSPMGNTNMSLNLDPYLNRPWQAPGDPDP
ncbi:hypothetical protein HD806DRAFT_211692 [Xylariaceae sp. AK1471]|nr:hypothetical protein HD806DRAFT_211692 [Xylariaceae sp. AK1471]